MNFDAIFKEYYTLYRGQATSIPVFADPEYQIAIQLANNAIRKWARADGEEWRELWTSAKMDGSGDLLTTTDVSYSAPSNMRKPPAFVYINGTPVRVVSPMEGQSYGTTDLCYFIGGNNSSYTLYYSAAKSGMTIDYVYLKRSTLITAATSKPEMSDINFMIQDMLASRAVNSRNNFLLKTAKSDAAIALQNMKIENHSGTAGNTINLFNNANPASFGVNNAGSGYSSALNL